jgi:hypothetical protein
MAITARTDPRRETPAFSGQCDNAPPRTVAVNWSLPRRKEQRIAYHCAASA